MERTISVNVAERAAYALLDDYNRGYEHRAMSCNKVWFRTLYEDLQVLGFSHIIASAKGSKQVREYAFKK